MSPHAVLNYTVLPQFIPHYYKADDPAPPKKHLCLCGETWCQREPEWVEERAGEVTFATWRALNQTAGTRGKTAIPYAALTVLVSKLRGKATKMHTVKRAVKRLEVLGMIIVKHSHTFGSGVKQHNIYTVLCTELPRLSNLRKPWVQLTLQAETNLRACDRKVMQPERRLLQKEDNRGGFRPGAGRKPKNQNLPITMNQGNQNCIITSEIDGADKTEKSKVAHSLQEILELNHSKASLCSNLTRARVEEFSAKEAMPDRTAKASTASTLRLVPRQVESAAVIAERIAAAMNGGARDCDVSPPMETSTKFVPPTISCTQRPELTPPSIPPPPELDPALNDLQRVQRMVAVFETVYARKMGKRCFTTPRGLAFGKGKTYSAMTKAAQALIDNRLAPVAWAKWSWEQWQELNPNKPAPIAWVFSASRMEKFHGWFHSEETANYGATVAPLGPKYRAMALRYRDAERAVVLAPTWGRARQLWEAAFPGDAFEQMVAEVVQECHETTASIRAQVKAGAYLW